MVGREDHEAVLVAGRGAARAQERITPVDLDEALLQPGELSRAEAAVGAAVQVGRVEQEDAHSLDPVKGCVGSAVPEVALVEAVTLRQPRRS